MKAIEVVRIMAIGMKILSEADIKTNDYRYIQLYDEYLKLRREGNKYDYVITVLSERYKLSQSTVSRLIRRLGKAVKT